MYFMSFPVLNFIVNDINGRKVELKWFPSEYLYRDRSDRYCSRANEVLMGGSFMRQNAFLFDVEAGRLGFARARCNDDPNMIKNETEMV
jgi:hypothetical protein